MTTATTYANSIWCVRVEYGLCGEPELRACVFPHFILCYVGGVFRHFANSRKKHTHDAWRKSYIKHIAHCVTQHTTHTTKHKHTSALVFACLEPGVPRRRRRRKRRQLQRCGNAPQSLIRPTHKRAHNAHAYRAYVLVPLRQTPLSLPHVSYCTRTHFSGACGNEASKRVYTTSVLVYA